MDSFFRQVNEVAAHAAADRDAEYNRQRAIEHEIACGAFQDGRALARTLMGKWPAWLWWCLPYKAMTNKAILAADHMNRKTARAAMAVAEVVEKQWPCMCEQCKARREALGR